MGDKLMGEVLGNHGPRPPREWWVLLDLAINADDHTRRVTCSLGYLIKQTKNPETAVRQWLANLHEAGLIRTIEHAAGGDCAVYEIQPIPPWVAPAVAPARTALYRIFGDADLLLYIGISKDFGTRWKQHAKAQPWWD